MTNTGVFAVARNIFDHPFFEPEPFTEREAWMWLIKEAARKPRRACLRNGVTIDLERGQLAHSTRFLAQRWQWPKTRVTRFLARTASDGMIGPQAGPHVTVITICNYDEYQFTPEDFGPQSSEILDRFRTKPIRKKDTTTKNNYTETPREADFCEAKQAPFLLPIDGGGTPAIRKPDLDKLERVLREAAGTALNEASTGLMILSDPLRWLGSGCDLDLDVVPTLRAVARRTSPGAVRVWNYYSKAVFETRDRRNAASPSPVIDIGRKGRSHEQESPTRAAIRRAREGG